MYRLRFAVSVLIVGLFAGSFLLGADEKTGSKKPIYIRTQLPPYYKKLGLSDKQKESILQIRVSYAVKVKELQRQIAELKAKEKIELVSVLTEGQKSRLRELSPSSVKGSEVKDKAVEVKKK